MRRLARFGTPILTALTLACSRGNAPNFDDETSTTGATTSAAASSAKGDSASAPGTDSTTGTTATTIQSDGANTEADAGSQTPNPDDAATRELTDANSAFSPDAPSSDDAGDAAALHDAGVRSFQNQCIAQPLQCGAHLQHSTVDLGTSIWDGYTSTQRVISGKEVLYTLDVAAGCDVNVILSDANVDLDLYLLTSCEFVDSTTFDLVDSVLEAMVPLSDETAGHLQFTVEPGNDTFIVVDGIEGAEGSYTLDVECSCP